MEINSAEQNNKDLKTKIWHIQNEIKSLIKDELNKFQNYRYFDEAQILKQLKPLLEKYESVMIISDDETQPFIHEREGTNHFLKYLKKMELTDLKSGQSQVFKFWACANSQDLAKAKGSAETYALKYILSKFFLIRVIDENDPELKQSPVINNPKKYETNRD